MEDNPLWSRRGFLGMGVGVLGAAGLAACGSSSSKAPPKAPAEVLAVLPVDREFSSADEALRAVRPSVTEILIGY